MAKVVEFINLECVECGSVELIMNIVDDVAMCPRCFRKKFRTNDPAIDEPEKYAELLAKLIKMKMPKVGDYRYTEDGIGEGDEKVKIKITVK